MREPIQGVQDSTSTSGKRVSGCLSECPTKIICYLKEDQSEFFEKRRQNNLSYSLKANEFTDLENQ